MDNKLIEVTFLLIQIPVFFFLCQGFIHSILTNLFKRERVLKLDFTTEYSYALIITSHQNTDFISPIVDSISKQNYKKFHAYIIADDCDISSLHDLNSSSISIIRPDFLINSKIKSIDYAIANFKHNHDFLIIFDPDNLLASNYLDEVNTYINSHGNQVVQTHLRAKNINNSISKLDALGSTYFDFIFRASKIRLGLSAHIYGSGIVISCKAYENIKYESLLGGFDKRIQLELIKKGYKIGYCTDAVVYDEKTDTKSELLKQRTRWIYSYFKYFKDGLGTIKVGINKLDFNIFYFGIESLCPPIIVLIITYIGFGVIDLILYPLIANIWLVVLLIFIISTLTILVKQNGLKYVLQSVLYLPKFFMIQLVALFRMKNARSGFLKTKHTQVLFIHDIIVDDKNRSKAN